MSHENDFKKCQAIHKKYGKSYYFATFFFPRHLKQATYALYAFFRLPDEIVDNTSKKPEEVLQDLQNFKKKWQKFYEIGDQNSGDDKSLLKGQVPESNQVHEGDDEFVLRATAKTFHKYNIPFEYSVTFLDAMISDVYTNRYDNYEALKNYMYGSASVVGLIMTYVIGFKNQDALPYAEKLGYAMQLTNFLRDIGEDFDLRNRVYMPLDELAKFNLSQDDIAHKVVNDNFVKFMKFQIDRARNLYKESSTGIKMLSMRGRFAVKMASVLYAEILNEIEKQNYDVYKQRAKTSFVRKLFLILFAIIKK